MSDREEFLLLKNHLDNSPFMSVKPSEAIVLIAKEKSRPNKAKDRVAELQVNYLLTMSCIYDCNKILKEIT